MKPLAWTPFALAMITYAGVVSLVLAAVALVGAIAVCWAGDVDQ